MPAGTSEAGESATRNLSSFSANTPSPAACGTALMYRLADGADQTFYFPGDA
jgi:hypothetical protein